MVLTMSRYWDEPLSIKELIEGLKAFEEYAKSKEKKDEKKEEPKKKLDPSQTFILTVFLCNSTVIILTVVVLSYIQAFIKITH
jgi:hypothetical protein